MYDLYVPMVAEADRHYTFEEAKDIVKTGLAPMGEEYLGLLQEGLTTAGLIYMKMKENEAALIPGAFMAAILMYY
mgnify:CR=1 FL=1